MSTALELRQQLEPVLLPWLGQYTLANGIETPAFSVRAAGQSRAPGTTVTGVEAVLALDPTLSRSSGYRAQEGFPVWTCYLVDWSGAEDLTGAALAVIGAFPGTTYAQLSVSEDVGPTNQVRLTIPERQSMTADGRVAVGVPESGLALGTATPSVTTV